MDWALLGMILAAVFFIATVILARRLAKRKKPAWAHRTTKIIGLGGDAPPELMMNFAGKPVTNVYRTTFIFLNKGNETIPQAHVTETIAVHFEGADILRKPTILAVSKEANKISVGQSTKEGDNVIALQFLYLDHNDGALVEVLHTESQRVRCSGNIMGTDKIEYMGEFIPRSSKPLPIRLGGFILLGIMFLTVITLVIMKYKFGIGGREMIGAIAMLAGVLLGALISGLQAIRQNMQSARLPAWSITRKEEKLLH